MTYDIEGNEWTCLIYRFCLLDSYLELLRDRFRIF